MKVVGLITEYNPFHTGHLYHLHKSIKLTEADFSIAVMSGNFLQRGEPAIVDKYKRAEMALAAGVDIVFELPFPFASHNAGVFAFGAISLLNSLGVITHLCFGSESGNLEELQTIAKILYQESENFKADIVKFSKEGLPYPEARLKALENELKRKGINPETLKGSNNILGIEYLLSLLKLKSSIKPMTIKRIGSAYLDPEIKGKFSSATAIRKRILESGVSSVKDIVPPITYKILKKAEENNELVSIKNFEREILILIKRLEVSEIREIAEVKEGLENRIKKAGLKAITIEELLQGIKTKRYTLTRISRILIHLLVGFKERENKLFQKTGALYAFLLGFSTKGKELLKEIKRRSSIPIITRPTGLNEPASIMLKLDLKATRIYEAGIGKRLELFQPVQRDVDEETLSFLSSISST
ncbi:MAG: nucleotidyltransferase [Synergistetes bacterium]|nr:nucleotidyltransferase [Synergistota bacterium]MCX8127192.1 nucleotidyltransferase [Synergistota bacterium]MDW8191922.1 nucleotidyltransferase [Synergistota bacterium]